MLGNLGLHVIGNPAGTYSLVGNVPASLGQEVLATRADVMGGRSFRNESGESVTIKFPVFATEAAAVAYAADKGFECHTPARKGSK